MEILVAILWDFLGEVLLQLLFQLIAEGAAHALAPYRRGGALNGSLSLVAHIVIGGGLGALSLLVWPHSVVRGATLRIGNLIVAPLFAGLATTAIGYLRRRNGGTQVPMEKFAFAFAFAFGFGFALAFGVVRFLATS